MRNHPQEDFLGAVEAGYRDSGGHLPGNWRRLARITDLIAWADMLQRPRVDPAVGRRRAAIDAGDGVGAVGLWLAAQSPGCRLRGHDSDWMSLSPFSFKKTVIARFMRATQFGREKNGVARTSRQ